MQHLSLLFAFLLAVGTAHAEEKQLTITCHSSDEEIGEVILKTKVEGQAIVGKDLSLSVPNLAKFHPDGGLYTAYDLKAVGPRDEGARYKFKKSVVVPATSPGEPPLKGSFTVEFVYDEIPDGEKAVVVGSIEIVMTSDGGSETVGPKLLSCKKTLE